MKTYDVKMLITIKAFESVEADSEDEAIEKAYDLVHKEFKDWEIIEEETEDVNSYEVGEENDATEGR